MLFDIVPEDFFRPLAAKGKTAYWECICTLFRITNSELSFGIERSLLVDELEYYFESNMSADIGDDDDDDVESRPRGAGRTERGRAAGRTARESEMTRSNAGSSNAEEPQSFEDKTQSASSMSPRDKANLMLRRLERWGWIYVDTDMSYVQRVNFRDYAISVIRALSALDTTDHPEYQGYIYTIYNQVKAGEEQAGVGLLQIVDNTEALISGLKSLNANIKKYIDELTRYSTVAEILEALLNDYYTNIIDKAYHRLMTSDNVAKFRPEIVSRLEGFSKNKKYLDKASQQIAEIKEISPEQARESALSMLHAVIDAFRKMDQIIEDINKKNMKYQRAAINRARFLLSSSDDIRGQLKNIICFIGEKAAEIKIDHNTVYELEQLDGLIKLFTVSYLDIDSLYTPVAGRKAFAPEPIEEIVVDEEERNRIRMEMAEKIRNKMTAEKIDRYVLEQLGERSQMPASQTDLTDVQGFIRLIYVMLYSQRRDMSYEVIPMGSKQDDTAIVTVNGYRFRDFTIKRKV